MQLSPLQSRLAASFLAICLLALLYLTLFSPHFALATNLPEIARLPLDELRGLSELEPRTPAEPAYEPDFAAFDRSILGRAPGGATTIVNNVATKMNVEMGKTLVFMFSMASVESKGSGKSAEANSLELRDVSQGASGLEASEVDGNVGEEVRRETDEVKDENAQSERLQAKTLIRISANTCLQPNTIDPSMTTEPPPQLILYVSTSTANKSPGPLAQPDSQIAIPFEEGAVMYNLSTSSDVYFGISAPNFTMYSGVYNVEVAGSADSWYHSYDKEDDGDLIWVDSDYQGALLITHNLTDSTDEQLQESIMESRPFVMFAQNQKHTSIRGLAYSFCGLEMNALIGTTNTSRSASKVQSAMTKRGPGNLPKQQFSFSGLNASTHYVGILVRQGVSPGTSSTKRENSATPLGVHVYRAIDFTTKSTNGSCAVIHDLDFCDQVAYSVPANPTGEFRNITILAQFYDSYAKKIYENFLKALAQVPCDAPPEQQYSLVRNCTSCSRAYKTWLCSVTMPRCEDFSNNASYLQPRAIRMSFPDGTKLDNATLAKYGTATAFTSSRIQRIDEQIKPGPYKEVLPCDDLCYDLVQSCPSSMGFSCPKPGAVGFNTSYGRRTGDMTCNFPGSAHVPTSGAYRSMGSWPMLAAVTIGFVQLAV